MLASIPSIEDGSEKRLGGMDEAAAGDYATPLFNNAIGLGGVRGSAARVATAAADDRGEDYAAGRHGGLTEPAALRSEEAALLLSLSPKIQPVAAPPLSIASSSGNTNKRSRSLSLDVLCDAALIDSSASSSATAATAALELPRSAVLGPSSSSASSSGSSSTLLLGLKSVSLPRAVTDPLKGFALDGGSNGDIKRARIHPLTTATAGGLKGSANPSFSINNNNSNDAAAAAGSSLFGEQSTIFAALSQMKRSGTDGGGFVGLAGLKQQQQQQSSTTSNSNSTSHSNRPTRQKALNRIDFAALKKGMNATSSSSASSYDSSSDDEANLPASYRYRQTGGGRAGASALEHLSATGGARAAEMLKRRATAFRQQHEREARKGGGAALNGRAKAATTDDDDDEGEEGDEENLNCPSNVRAVYGKIYNKNGRVGIYTPEERAERVARFLIKRRERVWTKKVRYGCRKNLAQSRMRVKGRFVKLSPEEEHQFHLLQEQDRALAAAREASKE